jgi:hypothetical protein
VTSVAKAVGPFWDVAKRVLAITCFLALTPVFCWFGPTEWCSVMGPAARGCDCIDCS